MKIEKNLKRLSAILILIGTPFLIGGCGSSGSESLQNSIIATDTSDSNESNITTTPVSISKDIPMCNENNTSAIVFTPEETIEKKENNTTARVWHYQNGDKVICILTGSATVTSKEKP